MLQIGLYTSEGQEWGGGNEKGREKTMKNVGLDNTKLQPNSESCGISFFFSLYIKTIADCYRSHTHCFLDNKRYQFLLIMLLISTCSIPGWGNGKTEHVQANIPTLPSGGGLPRGIFALILEVRPLGAFRGHLSLMVTKKVTANALLLYLFACTSPLSHNLVFRHFLPTSPLAC